MYCPQCGRKFWFRNTFCPDCRVGLVQHPPISPADTGPTRAEEPDHGEWASGDEADATEAETIDERATAHTAHTDPNLTRVLTAYNPALVALAESLLDAQGIEYMAQGADVTGFPIGPGPVEFWVRGDEADRARELLHDLRDASEQESSAPPGDEER